MKKSAIISLLFFLLVFSPALLAQSLDQDIQYIRSRFKEINASVANSTPENYDLSTQSTEGGKAMVYREEEWVAKMVVTYYGETGKLIEEFYFDEDILMFVFTQRFTYNRPIYESEEAEEPFDISKSKIEENRYYFTGDKLIKWIDDSGISIAPEENRFRVASSIVLKELETVRQQLN